MKKSHGIKVGRKLLTVWRWIRRRRHRQSNRSNYFRLTSISSPQYSWEKTTVAAKIADWRRLFSRLKPSSCTRLSKKDELFRDYYRLIQPTPKPPPKGHLAVYVSFNGGDMPHRAVVPIAFFNHPLFVELLQKAEKEFGYRQSGGITIPCPVSDFEGVCAVVAAEVGHRRTRDSRHMSLLSRP